nr:recombinase family protein [Bradyrhizobium niftali]
MQAEGYLDGRTAQILAHRPRQAHSRGARSSRNREWIFHEYLRHKSQATIARELNRRGIMNSQGRPWAGKAVGELLRISAF